MSISNEKRLTALRTLLAPLGRAVDEADQRAQAGEAPVTFLFTLDEVDVERIAYCLWSSDEEFINWIIQEKPKLS